MKRIYNLEMKKMKNWMGNKAREDEDVSSRETLIAKETLYTKTDVSVRTRTTLPALP